jgi:leucyl aminopeptidase (aminopeptidase T)
VKDVGPDGAILRMRPKYIRMLLTAAFVLAVPLCVYSQTEQCPYIDNPAHREPLSKQMKERMIELCIEENKKDFDRMVQRTEELAKISNEIEESFEEHNALLKEDREKLDKAEELLTKIRKELRADNDDDDDEDRPKNVIEAVKLLQENSVKLLDEIKKTTRHSVSALAIQSSNTVMRIVKFLRLH